MKITKQVKPKKETAAEKLGRLREFWAEEQCINGWQVYIWQNTTN